jgi:hypothetical protein
VVEIEFKVCLLPYISNIKLMRRSKIGGDGSHLFGDGMAVWLTTSRALPGPVFGSHGTLELQHNVSFISHGHDRQV